MTVTVDIGNTNIVMGFWENDAPKVFRFETSVSGTYNEYYAAIKPALLEVFPQLRNGVPDLLSEQKISGVKWGISSVVPSLTGIIEQILRSFFSLEPVVLNKELFMRSDFPVKIPDSAVDEIGTDIICDAFGALETGGRSVIVDFGTALTITAVDFDGTIVEHRYPAIGREIPFAMDTLKLLAQERHQLILWTVREGRLLDEAVEFCRSRGLEFYAVNSNYPEEQDTHRTFSRKLQADLFIDDRNLGGLPDWGVIYRMIHDKLTFEEVYGSKSLQAEAGAQQPRRGWLTRLLKG